MATSIKRGLIIALAAIAACLGVGLGVASPASATGKNGALEAGELGLYYFTGQSGYLFDLYLSDPDFSNDVFPGTSISANNNTESWRNLDTYWWRVFTGANYTGSGLDLAPFSAYNFPTTFFNTISSAYYYTP
ncbi:MULTISPECIES: peptidase inhibitor family I36 protein [unclassified Frankia]|uniref:peptidase inhibitor family I36 protein n=1 Tax=unclassified Frankia TaxID=2632575 RepID=UPI001EF4E976|nr:MULTISPECIES: peptidase inhibitor family I36 protein [unclassified Frankia]